MTSTSTRSLSHSWHASFWKLFGTNDVDCINDIQRFMGYLPLVTEIDARRVGFYPRDAMLARVIAIATCPSVCLSVCPSVRHAPVLCQNEES